MLTGQAITRENLSKASKIERKYPRCCLLVLIGFLPCAAFGGALTGFSSLANASSQSTTVTCRIGSGGTVVDDSACNKFATTSKPGPESRPCPYTGSCGGGGSDSDDSDDSGGAGYRDTDGDGVGDTYSDSCSGYCSEERGEDIDNFYDRDTSDDGGNDGDNDGGGGGSSVLCTYFYQKGILQENLYYADIENAHSMINPIIMRGYHAWSISYVRYLRKHPNGMMEKLIKPIVLHRAQEVAYQLGVSDKPDYIGKLIRMTFEPACFAIGLFAEKRDWRDLYNARDFKAFAKGYRRYKAFKADRAAFAI